MGDIAAIFHWSHAELAAMSIDELLRWRERAVATWNRMNTPKEGSS